MQALGLSWDEVHAEAERLEHHLSEALEARIDAALGHPTRDPHGDPIPTPELELADEDDRPLSELARGAEAVIRRVPDGDPGLLRYLAELGFLPDERVVMLGARALRRPADGRGGRRAPCHLARARRAHPHRWERVNPPPPVRTDLPAVALPGEQKVLEAAQRSLAERRGGLRGLWPFLGPAFIAAIAYVDPGNFATNIAAGSKYGYLLLWVILVSNLMAMLIQTMSAKLGIATGHNLAEVSREAFSKPMRIFLWLQAEAVAMAVRPGRVRRRRARLPPALRHAAAPRRPAHRRRRVRDPGRRAARRAPPRGGHHGARRASSWPASRSRSSTSNPDGTAAVKGLLTPQFSDSESVLLAAGILGATVMPHVIYLHSSLTQRRVIGANADERRRIFRFEQIDVVIAMTIAGLVNMAMLIMAAGVFHSRGLTEHRRHRRGLPRARHDRRQPRRRHLRHRAARLRASRPRASARWPGRS